MDAFLNIGHYALDGKEVDGLIGTSHRRLKRKRPCCMQTSTNTFILPKHVQMEYRNDNAHELVAKRAWEVKFDKIIYWEKWQVKGKEQDVLRSRFKLSRN